MTETKSVLITGANSGIGLATALELAQHGYDVIGTVRSEDKADALRDAALEKGAVVRSVVWDVSDADQAEQGYLEVAAMTDGGPWALINNAGFTQAGAVEDVHDDLARAQLETNVITPARLARLVLPSMRERGDGRILMMSSIAGRVSMPFLGWYHASKHALEALTDSLRMEVSQFGVKVVLIEPGSFGSNIWSDAMERLPDRESSAYAAAYKRADFTRDHVDKLPDPVWVARAVRLALATKHPMRRYLVGFDAMAGTALDTLTPSILSDYVKRVAAGVGRLPFTHPHDEKE